jgi:hypothetical protein
VLNRTEFLTKSLFRAFVISTSRLDPGNGDWPCWPISPVIDLVDEVLETCVPLGTRGFDSEEAYLAFESLLTASLGQLGKPCLYGRVAMLGP